MFSLEVGELELAQPTCRGLVLGVFLDLRAGAASTGGQDGDRRDHEQSA
jgi:hypothetical protein